MAMGILLGYLCAGCLYNRDKRDPGCAVSTDIRAMG